MRVAMIVRASCRREDARNPGRGAPQSEPGALHKGRGGIHHGVLHAPIDRDGLCTMANAGHLPPYIDGKEMAVPPSLPLGITEVRSSTK